MKRFIVLLSVILLASPFAASASERFVDVIVSLKAGEAPGTHAANQALAAQVAAEYGLSPSFTYGTVFVGFAARVPEAQLDALRNDPRVDSVSFDGPVHALRQGPPGGGGGGGQVIPWGIKRIGADTNTNEASGIHVYIIDTGIDSDHPDLQANLGNGFAAVTCRGGRTTCRESWDDDNGHGTHVAGTAGAIDNDTAVLGVASQVTLHAVKVLDRSGSGSFAGVTAGVDFVANEVAARGQAGVANMSLGGGGSKTGTCTATGFTGDDNFHKAICNAARVGVVFAVAAGNAGDDAEGTVPAAYDDAVITVSAVQCSVSNQTCESGTEDWPSFSNWGDNSADWTPHNSAPVAIAAPGVSVLSTWNDGGTNTISGTSMASPHVAGSAALFLASNAQAADFSAFTNTRAGLLAADESTDTFNNTSGNPHDEDFVDASNL